MIHAPESFPAAATANTFEIHYRYTGDRRAICGCFVTNNYITGIKEMRALTCSACAAALLDILDPPTLEQEIPQYRQYRRRPIGNQAAA